MVTNPFGFGPQSYHTQTNIQPTGLYSNSQTQQAVNQGVAHNQQNGLNLFKSFNNPASGFSNGPAQMSQAAGGLAQMFSQNNMLKAMQPMQDHLANAQQQFGGQQAQEQQGLNNVNQLGQGQALNQGQGIQNLNSLYSMLGMMGFPQNSGGY